MDSHPWRTPILGSSGHTPLPTGCIQCAQFDSTGELLVTGGEDGTILVHSGETLLSTAETQSLPPNAAQDALVRVAPMLALRTGLPRVHHVRWNPANENIIAASSSTSRHVHVFDLQHTQGRPKQTITLPVQNSGGAGDVAFFGGGGGVNAVPGGGGYTFLVGGSAGQVYVWDIRASGPPATVLHSSRGGAVTSVALIEQDMAVVAATQAGDLKSWDLRGGSGGALRFGGVVQHHPLLASIDLRAALGEVPDLVHQAGRIPSCAVHAMQLSPTAPHRAAFHLGCGWSGVYDLLKKKVTHVHAPAQPVADVQPTEEDGARALVMWAQMAAPTLRRKACWSGDGRWFAVPSRQRDEVALLDFSDSRHAGCYALAPLHDDDDDGGGGDGVVAMKEDGDEMICDDGDEHHLHRFKSRRNPSAVGVPLSQAAICAAAMPVRGGSSGLIVAAGAHNFLSLIRPA